MSDPEAVMADWLAIFEGTDLTADRLRCGYGVVISAAGRTPFTVGEIIPMKSEFEREIGGDERKPSKWERVTCEWFGMDYAAARRRAASLT